MSAVPDLTHYLPAVAIARLAAHAEAQTALASLLEIGVKQRSTSACSPLANSFAPTQRCLNKAAQGLAALVLAHAPGMAGDVRDDITGRLVRLGIPADVAAAIVSQLEARHVLTRSPQTPKQQHDNVTTFLAAHKFLDGRL